MSSETRFHLSAQILENEYNMTIKGIIVHLHSVIIMLYYNYKIYILGEIDMKLKKHLLSLATCTAVVLSGLSVPNYAQNDVSAAESAMQTFSLGDFVMEDAYCSNALKLEYDYLASFDTNRLLSGFRQNAGLNTFGAKRYDGWENSLIAGHCVGHYLTAVAQGIANATFTEEQHKVLYGKMTAVVDGLLECQKNSKGKQGFIWGAPVNSGQSVEGQFDNVEHGKTSITTEAWVPWYTMHKILQGLVDVYNLTGYENAKTVASGVGDWSYNRAKGWNDSTHRTVLGIEFGGMNECLYDLYAITGKESHAVAAHYFDDESLYQRISAGGANALNNMHSNTTIPKFLGALKRYIVLDGKTINGQKVDASAYLKYVENFWQMVVDRHTYANGGCSEWERWGEDYKLDKERTNCNCETCIAYNMLKMSRTLFAITGDKKYMDYYENTYYNSMLSSQNPETGMTTYFQPMATGYFKCYSTPYTKFWCCTGSGMESFTKLGDANYMADGNTLYVNIYQSGTLNWKEQNVTVKQESNIPQDDTANFTISGSGDLDFRFRIPDWAAANPTITVNGTKYTYTNVNGYADVKGSFKDGDKIAVKLPAQVTVCTLPDSSNSYAFKYGPILLSTALGTSNMKEGSTGMWVTIPADKVVQNETVTISNNQSVEAFMFNINENLVKDPDSMKFTLKGTNQNLVFTPHYLQYKERYGIYFYYKSATQGSAEDIPRSRTSTVDTVQAGYGQYENDNLHLMTDNNSVGSTDGSTFRYAQAGGSFGYKMAINPEAAFSFVDFMLAKEDNGKTLRVVVGDTILYDETLNYTGNAETYKVNLMIPQSVIDECAYEHEADGDTYTVLDVMFYPTDGKDSARVCEFIHTTAVTPVYKYDSDVAYFVNCGDHNVSTACSDSNFGLYNSLTEQLYGADKVSGYEWGLIDDATDQYNGSSKSKGIYTANTWPNENSTGDATDKTGSFRYTKNQYENNIARHLDYGFTLPNGTYKVEVGYANPWNCSNKPSCYANYGTANQQVIAESTDLSSANKVSGSVSVTDGTLSLNFRSEDKAINVTYIKISFDQLDELPKYTPEPPVDPPTEKLLGDVNCDGVVTVSDAILMSRISQEDTTVDVNAQGLINGDANEDGVCNSADVTVILHIVAKLV